VVRRRVALVALGLALGSVGAAGAGSAKTGVGIARSARGVATLSPRDRQMEAIVTKWSRRLNAGDNNGIAELFSVPATIIQAPYAYRLPNRHTIALWFAELPCSGRIESIRYSGDSATAVFVLGNRGSTRCDGPGTLAAARFEIIDGKITRWEQVPVPPKQVPPTVA
jgi:hypothetical protein